MPRQYPGASHRCVAAQLVPLIGRIFVEELARSYRLTIISDGPREHGRFHWQPSPRLRVRLEPRDDETSPLAGRAVSSGVV